MVGQWCPGKGCSFSSAQTFGQQMNIRPLGTIFQTRTVSLRDSSTLQYREGQGCAHLGPSQNQFPSDLKFFSLIIVARASYVDCVGALGFWQDLSHALPVCAVPRVSHTSTLRLRTVRSQGDAKASYPTSQRLSSRTFLVACSVIFLLSS